MTTAVTRRALERTMRRAVWTAALAAMTTACAATGATPKPFPTPGGHMPVAVAGAPLPGSSHPPANAGRPVFDGYALVGTALALRGAPYRDGGSNPNGFDCSGFTQYVFAQYGIPLPRNVHEQYREGKPVKPQEIGAG